MGERVFRTGLATHLQEVCEGTLKASTQVEYVLLSRRGARDLAELLFQSSTLQLQLLKELQEYGWRASDGSGTQADVIYGLHLHIKT